MSDTLMETLKFERSKDLKFNLVCIGFEDPTAVIWRLLCWRTRRHWFCRKCDIFCEKFGIHPQHSRRKVKVADSSRTLVGLYFYQTAWNHISGNSNNLIIDLQFFVVPFILNNMRYLIVMTPSAELRSQ